MLAVPFRLGVREHRGCLAISTLARVLQKESPMKIDPYEREPHERERCRTDKPREKSMHVVARE